ncbi:MAG: adenylate/guanylate cyclase domain-containing protein [Rhodospirillaceae bacterium]
MEVEFTILFIDVCDSTRIYEARGNVEATAIIQGALQRIHRTVLGQKGRVIKNLGDGLMCVFQAPDHGAAAAEDIAADALEVTTPNPVRFRIGLHFGSVVERESDVFGDAINVAARVESLASPGEILLTDEVVARLSMSVRDRCQFVDTTTVKGKSVPIRIYKLRRKHAIDDDTSERTVVPSALMNPGMSAILTLRLVYLGKGVVVSHDKPKVTIGRSEDSHIIILSRQASRQHGALEFSRESFVLTDHSSNGTYIRTGGGAPILLRRDSTRLVGSGLLGIGAVPERMDDDHVIRFLCDIEV